MKTIRETLLKHKDNRAGIIEFARRCAKRAKGYTATAYPYITYATAADAVYDAVYDATYAAAATDAATDAADAADAAAATAVATSTDATAAFAAFAAERAIQRADLVAIFGEGEL